jgi:hypothetical protein
MTGSVTGCFLKSGREDILIEIKIKGRTGKLALPFLSSVYYLEQLLITDMLDTGSVSKSVPGRVIQLFRLLNT